MINGQSFNDFLAELDELIKIGKLTEDIQPIENAMEDSGGNFDDAYAMGVDYGKKEGKDWMASRLARYVAQFKATNKDVYLG